MALVEVFLCEGLLFLDFEVGDLLLGLLEGLDDVLEAGCQFEVFVVDGLRFLFFEVSVDLLELFVEVVHGLGLDH